MKKQYIINYGVSVIIALFFITIWITVRAAIETHTAASKAMFYFPSDGDFVQVGYPPKALHYIRRGKGPTVVLIHGDGGSTYDWTMANFDQLARHYDVIAIDRPGFGFSETLPHQSVISQVRYIHRGLQLMGVRHPVLVGHSLGGEAATLFAEEYPNEIAGVVTLGGVCMSDHNTKLAWQYDLLHMPVIGNCLAHTFCVPFGQSIVKDGLDHAFAPERTSPDTYAKTYTALLMRPQTLLNWAIDHGNTLLDTLIIPRYKAIRVPFVIVNGQADQIVPIAMARQYSQMIPGSRLLEVTGAGHELMFSHPDIVERAIGMLSSKASGK